VLPIFWLLLEAGCAYLPPSAINQIATGAARQKAGQAAAECGGVASE